MADENKPPVLVHIGFHKTGSTFLQNNLFFRNDQGFASPWTVNSGEAIEHLVLTHPCRFDAAKIRHLFWEAVAKMNGEGMIPTISHEDLSGHPVKQKYYEFEVAERIHAVFPDAKVFIVVREQKSIIRSFYNQHVKQGGEFGIQYFLGDETTRRPGFSPLFRLDHLEYDLLVERYIEHFGAESVLVLPQEILARDQQLFLRKLYDFVGHPAAVETFSNQANVSLKAATVELRRMLNAFPGKLPPLWQDYESTPALWRAKNRLCRYANTVLPTALHKRVDTALRQYISDRVGNYYEDSNHRLQKYVDFDLKQLGYDV